jgi:hypothetical protein
MRSALLYSCCTKLNKKPLKPLCNWLERCMDAEGGTRTPTPLRAQRPERCVSTNFTTSACLGFGLVVVLVDSLYSTGTVATCQVVCGRFFGVVTLLALFCRGSARVRGDGERRQGVLAALPLLMRLIMPGFRRCRRPGRGGCDQLAGRRSGRRDPRCALHGRPRRGLCGFSARHRGWLRPVPLPVAPRGPACWCAGRRG